MPEVSTILIVDDEADIVSVLQKRLVDTGYEVMVASDGQEALENINQKKPDLILLDIMMPRLDGMGLKQKLNEREELSDIPIIFLTAKTTSEGKLQGLRLMVDDYITKPFEPEELLARIENTLTKRRHYEFISMRDSLTGLFNLSYFKKQLDMMFRLSKRHTSRVFSIAVLDVDHFKSINDTFGHLAGNAVLKKIAECLNEVSRKSDVVTRYGGDEFAVLLHETEEEGAKKVFERFKQKIQSQSWPFAKGRESLLAARRSGPGSAPSSPGGESVAVVVSVGIATYEDRFKDEDELFKEADQKMYEEKRKNKEGDARA